MSGTTNHYAVITRKYRLLTEHGEWIEATRHLYNEVIGFYYQLYFKYPEVWEMGNQPAMRRLEELTIVGRNKAPVPEPLPWDKIPLYFRRSAINQAIASAKSFIGRDDQKTLTQSFDMAVVLYKGMYKDMDGHKLKIQLYDGNVWHWVSCRLAGNHLEKNEEWLSPRLVTKKYGHELHVPVREEVADGRTLKKRMDDQLKICSVVFSHKDMIAVCCIMDMDLTVQSVRFLRGGNMYEKQCKDILQKIEVSRKSCGNIKQPKENRRYWKKLHDISEDRAHQISRQIVDFSRESQAAVIVLPKYSNDFSKIIMSKAGRQSSLYLNYRIREKLNYKAWQAGILIAETNVKDIRRMCAVCGASITEKMDLFVCENGHRGDRRLNTVRNLGRNFIESMNKRRL